MSPVQDSACWDDNFTVPGWYRNIVHAGTEPSHVYQTERKKNWMSGDLKDLDWYKNKRLHKIDMK